MNRVSLSDFIATFVKDLAITFTAVDSSVAQYKSRFQELGISLDFSDLPEEIKNLRVTSLVIDIPVQWSLSHKKLISAKSFSALEKRLMISSIVDNMNRPVKRNDRLYLEVDMNKVSYFEYK